MIKRIQLPLQTFNLVLGFMIWVIISSLLPFIVEDIDIPTNKLALVTALPVILGSILRVPIGYYTNQLGARAIFLISFALLLPPVFYLSVATTYVDLLISGLFLGIAGAVFSVGVTSLPKYYPKERHGFVNGIYGVGNLGTAISTFGAPILATQIGWSKTVQVYLILLGIFILINAFLGDKEEPKVKTSLMEQINSVYKNDKLWLLSLFYFITFGSFVAFTVYLPNFLVENFNLDKVDAGFRTAGFIVIATGVRPLGGWLGDKMNSHIILMYVFGGITLSAILLSFAPSITWYSVGCLTIAFCAGLGNGVIFKLVPTYFQQQAGIANGIVSALGGLGGFFPPIILSVLFSITGHYAIGFMALSQVSLASLILVIMMYYKDQVHFVKEIIEHTIEGIVVTDKKGKIISVNKAFSEITGYEKDEVLGENPNILQSDRQNEKFYKQLWETIEREGSWQGEIWNKRKNGEVFLSLLTISSVTNEAGEVIQYAGMFNDLEKSNTKERTV